MIQRLLVGATLLYFELTCLSAKPVCPAAAQQSMAALGGVLLIAGLWTPVAGVLVMSVEAWIAFSAPAETEIPVLLAVLGLSLAMIGPGAWSVDAWRFGRKHITLPEP